MFKTYLFDYKHEGQTWSLSLKAENENDALKRLESIQGAELLGEHVETVV